MEDVDVLVKNLEIKIIKEFNSLLIKVKKGYKPDYEFLLEEISTVEIAQNRELDNKLLLTMLEFFVNREWIIE